ncbi:MAG: sel1 repeat family protein [Gammaproteobacteria bacterium]|nr:sel1 repeat family protein [Gammaproteobacteria bacterium]
MVLADADFDDSADILDPDSQYKIALLYLNGDGVKRDKTTALKWLELAARRDYQDAKMVLAALQSGKETVFDAPASPVSKAISPEAKKAEAESFFQQGDVYHQGIGVSRDYSKAADWYRQAAELGHAEAQFRLGELYKRGRGVRRSKKLAAKWFQAAANQGHIKAKYFLNGCAFC